jgi:hypothetical protein
MNYGPLTIQFKQKTVKMKSKYRKYIQREETKLRSPPLESFHGNFKTSACVFYSASENYIQVPNS